MGRAPCCEKVGLKKGRWTAEEDEILINYIQANGEGSWRSLPKNAGLLRCGKSCRLRWINYLRADLKRGNISAEEEDVIVKFHTSLGNRWSLIASKLPGRTDNEIKNYWNSHLSRKIDTFRKPITTINTPGSDHTNSFSSSTLVAAAMINNNNNIKEKGNKMGTHSKRRGGRTSRWAMKKNKTYTFNCTQRHKGRKAQNHHKDINNDIASGGGRDGVASTADDDDHLNVVGEAITTMQDDYMILVEPTADHDHHDAKDDQKDCRAPSPYDDEQQEAGSGAMPMGSSSNDEKETHDDESLSLRPCEERRSISNKIDDHKEISDGEILRGSHNSNSQSSHDDDDDTDASGGIDGGLLATFNDLMDNIGLLDPNGVLTLSNNERDQPDQLERCGGDLSSSTNGQLMPTGGDCRYSCSSMSMASSISSAGNFDIDYPETGNNIEIDHHMLWDLESSVVQAGHDYLWDDENQNILSWLWEGTTSTATTTHHRHDHHNWEGEGDATNATTANKKFVREAVDPAEKQNAMVTS